MKRIALAASFVLLVGLLDLAAQQTVIVVRHAERADGGAGTMMAAADPELSDAGRARAASLASTLKHAGVTAIFVTEYKRTQQTAEPLAKALGLRPAVVSAKESAALLEKITAATGPVLVVGHSNTIPAILNSLGVADPPKIGDADYDDLFIVQRGEKPTLLRLHYR